MTKNKKQNLIKLCISFFVAFGNYFQSIISFISFKLNYFDSIRSNKLTHSFSSIHKLLGIYLIINDYGVIIV